MKWTVFLFACLLIDAVHSRILHKPHEFLCGALFVFGDSLSDDGIEVADESYGFERTSNGPVWPEYLQKMLACDRYVNYAYSGAKSGRDNFYFPNWSGLLWQVERFVDTHPQIPSDSLMIMQAGGAIDFFTGNNKTQEVVENIHEAMNVLLKTMTAGTILVLNIVDQSSAPGVLAAEESQVLQKRISAMVGEANTQLTHLVYDSELGLRKKAPAITVRVLDLNGVVVRAMTDLNTTEPFTHHTKDTGTRSIYQYAYHDLWHPSTFVHHKIAQAIVRELQDL
ncbi:unnamed protein product, partial [Mesorhabditis belari]|uniref:SGNH hydrolase-type esterase domain-containing protein n=1 Tax=Mesorhabditis belari TaxID=2138241 RepID=A0AAF3EUL4_9BILA